MKKPEKKKDFKSIKIAHKTHQQLKYLSLITGKKMSNIFSDILNNITALSVMYSKGCSIQVSHRVTDSTVYINLRGYSPSFAFGTAKNDFEMHEKAKAQLKTPEKGKGE